MKQILLIISMFIVGCSMIPQKVSINKNHIDLAQGIAQTYNQNIPYIFKDCTIYLKGSTTLSEYRNDLKAIPVYDKKTNTWMHYGFKKLSKQLYEKIDINSCKKLTITGHSLGGAIAVILGSWYEKDGIKSRIITFGQPRIYTWYSAYKQRNLDVTRYVYKNDIVSSLPPIWSIYMHIGKRVQLGDGNDSDIDIDWKGAQQHVLRHYIKVLEG